MKLPVTPKKSQDPMVLEKCAMVIDLEDFTAVSVDLEEVKDLLRKRPQGILVLITNEYKNNYKIFCMNTLRLHFCQITENLYEVVNSNSWSHSLDSIAYYNFIPHDCWAELDALKNKICAHLTGQLLDAGKVVYSRGTKYFYEVSIHSNLTEK